MDCFKEADKVYMGPVYPAGESPIPGITSRGLAREINKRHPGLVEPLSSMEEMKGFLSGSCQGRRQVVLSLGAGSVGEVVREWVQCRRLT